MTGDSSAETTAEHHGRSATQPTGESAIADADDVARDDVASSSAADGAAHSGANGQGGLTPEHAVAHDAAPEPQSQPVAQQPAALDEQPAPAEAPAPAPVAAEEPPPTSTGAPVAEDAPAAAEPAPLVSADTERPAVGPKILGIAEPAKPLPTVKAALPARKRRRRPSAAERHRRAFFSALTDLRRGVATPASDESEAHAEHQPDDDQTSPPEAEVPAVDAEAAVAVAEAVEQSVTPTPTPEAGAEAQTASGASSAPAPDRSPTSPARVTAAIERVGGAEIIKEALKPKQDEKGQPLKWAAVCAQAAEGLKPGDPIFGAWVRLAATPVREVKAQLPRPAPPEGASRGERAPGRRPGGPRPTGGGRGDRPRRDDRSGRQEYASHAQDGTLRKSIRIVTGHDEDQERRERERNRKEQREAKRRAERERLARLGY